MAVYLRGSKLFWVYLRSEVVGIIQKVEGCLQMYFQHTKASRNKRQHHLHIHVRIPRQSLKTAATLTHVQTAGFVVDHCSAYARADTALVCPALDHGSDL